jgi:predicted TIM-barrel fold metal-dependent hydrolase
MEGIIDFHTHAFPDSLADRAIKILAEEAPGVKAFLDGRVSSLLSSMDKAGIERSVVCSIATKPEQYGPILKWSKGIASDRIIPFPSFHPADPDFDERIKEIRGEGFRGVKFHPYYQDFNLDEERMLPIYEKIAGAGLIVVMHTGFDIAFERIRKCDPRMIAEVYGRFPGIRLVTTHLGAWEDWDEVDKYLAGKEVYMEISFSLEFLEKGRVGEIIRKHPKDYLFFGTDSPWTGQGETLRLFLGLELGEEANRLVLRENARRLLSSVG